MEPKFQTAFIPKTPIIPQTSPTAVGNKHVMFNLLPTIASILFVLTLLVSGGLLTYEHLLNSQITDDGKALALARSSFDIPSLQKLIDVSNKIKSAEVLLDQHVAVSPLFSLLESQVLPQVRFNTFTFDKTAGDGSVIIGVDGESSSYAALSEQSAIFARNSLLEHPSFSTMDVSPTGSITMKFQTTINPKLVSFTSALNTTNTSQSVSRTTQ